MDQFTSGDKPDDDSDPVPQPQDSKDEKLASEKEKVRSSTDLKTGDNDLTPLQEYPDLVGDKALKNAIPSKTPVPQLSGTNSMEDLRDIQRLRANLSKASLNFGSRSNLSSICHIEEISEGRASIDRQEYKLQRKRPSQTERMDPRSS